MVQHDSALVQKRSARRPAPRRRRAALRKPVDLRSAAEALLREVAFVCHATQVVRKAMEQTARPSL
jgi:hypothetical protein